MISNVKVNFISAQADLCIESIWYNVWNLLYKNVILLLMLSRA